MANNTRGLKWHFGNHSKVSIIEILIESHPEPLSPTEIKDTGEVSRQSWYRHHEDLIDCGIIEKKKEDGNSVLYGLNDDSPATEVLQKLHYSDP